MKCEDCRNFEPKEPKEPKVVSGKWKKGSTSAKGIIILGDDGNYLGKIFATNEVSHDLKIFLKTL